MPSANSDSREGWSIQVQAGDVWQDILALFVHPADVFAELPRTNRSGQALLILILLHLAYAVALISTGLPDFEVDADAQQQLSRYAAKQEGEEKKQEVDKALDSFDKGAKFGRVLERVRLFLGGPLRVLLGVGLIAGLLFALVAVQGGKPSFAILAGIVIFASYVEVPRLAVRLYLMSQLQASRVETSAAAFLTKPDSAGLPNYLLLRRLDPFEVWFWALIAVGAFRSGQMNVKNAIRAAVVLGLIVAFFQALLDLPELADLSKLFTSEETGP